VSPRRQGRSPEMDGRPKNKPAHNKIKAVERLAKHIHRASYETDQWWYDEKANRSALRACRLSRTELADAVAELVLEGRAYFGRNTYFPFLKLVNWLDELEDYRPGRSLAGLIWCFSKLGGYLIRCNDEGPPFTWVFSEARLAFVTDQPWSAGEWLLIEEVNWDKLRPRRILRNP
jgi:hypothetical protein